MSFGTKSPRFYERDGVKLPSVTTILSLLDKPALTYWSANCAVDYILDKLNGNENVTNKLVQSVCESARKEWRKVSKKAMDIGTEVHNAVEVYLKTGKEPKDPRDEVLSAFLAFLEWQAAHSMEPIEIEKTIFTDSYAGTLDLICNLDGKRYLIDLKSSKGIFDEYALQTASYRRAYEDSHSELDGHGVLRLDKETGYPEWKDFSGSYDKDFSAFMCLVEFWKITRGEK